MTDLYSQPADTLSPKLKALAKAQEKKKQALEKAQERKKIHRDWVRVSS